MTETLTGKGGGLRLAAKLFWALVLLACLGFVAQRLWQFDWASLHAHFSARFFLACAGAIGLFACADVLLARAWAMLADPHGAALRGQRHAIYAHGVLMKYLPGSIFQYLGRQAQGAKSGLPHGQLARASGIEIALHLASSVMLGLACLAAAKAPLVAAGVVVAAILIAWQRPWGWAHPLVLQLTAFACFAASAGVMAAVVLPGGIEPMRFAGLFLFAWVAGFVVPVAPGGLGVREAALLALAGQAIDQSGLLAAVLALRITSIGGDVLYAVPAILLGREGRAQNPT